MSKQINGSAKTKPRTKMVQGEREEQCEEIPRRNRAQVVRGLLRKMEQTLGQGEVKPTVSDFIRLLQLQKEMDDDEVREVTVTWVEQSGKGKRKEK